MIQLIGHAHKRFSERGQLDGNNLPDRADIDAEIVVDENVPEAGDSAPRDIRLAVLRRPAEALARFSQGLQIADDRVLNEAGFAKALLVASDIFLDSGDAFEHVLQIYPVRLRARLHPSALRVFWLRSARVRAWPDEVPIR